MASGTWTAVATTGSWGTTASWLSGVIANGASSDANFTSNITATTTITLDISRTIGGLYFSDNAAAGSAWVIAVGANVLTLNNGASSPVIDTATNATLTATTTGIQGTNGFTKSNSATLTTAADLSSLTGQINVTGGRLTLTRNGTYTLGNALSTLAVGFPGDLYFSPTAASTISLTGSQSAFGGLMAFTATVAATYTYILDATSGSSGAGNTRSYLFTQSVATGTITQVHQYNGATAAIGAKSVDFNSGTAGTQILQFLVNSTGDYSIGWDYVEKQGTNAGTLQLNAASTGVGRMGTPVQAAGVLSIAKLGTGKWVLGTNGIVGSHTGATTLSAGTLEITDYVLSESTLTHSTAGTTLQFTPSTYRTSIGGLSGSQPIALTDTAGDAHGITVGSYNIAYNTTYSGAFSGGGDIEKNGLGSLTLSAAAHTFTGNVRNVGGLLSIGTTATTTNPMPGGKTYTVYSGLGTVNDRIAFITTTSYTRGSNEVFTSDGNVPSSFLFSCLSATAGGMVFPAGTDFSGINGPSCDGLTTGYGFAVWTTGTNTNSYVTVSDSIPAVTFLQSVAGTAAIFCNAPVSLTSTGYETYATVTAAVATTSAVYANHSDPTLGVYVNTLRRQGTAATTTYQLRGTSTSTANLAKGVNQWTGVVNLQKLDAGYWKYSEYGLFGIVFYTGTTTVSGGTLESEGSLGSSAATAALSVATGAALLDYSGGIDDRSLAQMSVAGAGVGGAAYALVGGFSFANLVLTAASTLSARVLCNTGGVSGAFALTLDSTGPVATAAIENYAATLNSFSGALTAKGLVFFYSYISAALANGGTNSVLGASTNAAANLVLGAAATPGGLDISTPLACSTNRNFTVGNFAAKDAALGEWNAAIFVTGADVLWAGSPTYSSANTAVTLSLGAYYGTSWDIRRFTFSNVIGNNGSGAVSLLIGGSDGGDGNHYNIVKLASAPTYTGKTVIDGAVLEFNDAPVTLLGTVKVRAGGIANGTSGNSVILSNAAGLVLMASKVTAHIALGSNPLSVQASDGVTYAMSISEIAPTGIAVNYVSNTMTGAVSVDGVSTARRTRLRLTYETDFSVAGRGRILGTSPVTVNAYGELHTNTGTTQRGRMRYGGNLTFQANSRIRIGGRWA